MPTPTPTPFPGRKGLSAPEEDPVKKKILEKIEEEACKWRPDACDTADNVDCHTDCSAKYSEDDPDYEKCVTDCERNAGRAGNIIRR